ncbi:MAG: hypothetical protein ACTSU4_02375 [Promethearchaeota archaeon]
MHSITHPPGAVLFFYVLSKIFIHPILISIAVCFISTIFSGFFFNQIMCQEFKIKEHANYITFLFLLVPAIQIYFLANLYAIIITLFLSMLYFYYYSSRKLVKIIGCSISLILVSFLTFLFVFIVFYLFLRDLYSVKKIKSWKILIDLLIINLILLSFYILLYLILSFNYFNSFIIASTFENPGGFSFIVNPYGYFINRVKGILDIIIFFGPFLLVIFIKAMRFSKNNYVEIYVKSILTIALLIFFLLIGVYRYGETARSAIFIYPFLLFPISCYLLNEKSGEIEKFTLLNLVFGQTLLMQFLFVFFW